MDLRSETHPGLLLIRVGDSRIDAARAVQFKDEMRALTEGVKGRVVLDLAAVDFIDSSGLGAIVAAMKQLDSDQILELAALSPTVEKVFRLTRMDSVFTIHPDAAAALAATDDTG